jgi:hypothetical protein
MKDSDVTQIIFPKLGHFWFDSGLVGLIKMLEKVNLEEVSISINDTGLSIKGASKAIEKVLCQAYNEMVERYYNLSTRKQKEKTASYNFYYDTKKDCFSPFPKRKSVGVAGIIYNKVPRPTGGSIAWKEKITRTINFNGKIVKKTRGILPEKYAYLQERLDAFLDENGLDVTTSGLLIDGPNAVKPNVKIQVGQKTKKEHCFICGEVSGTFDEANQTVFPFITGSSGVLSFNSDAGKPGKICWKCALLGKFVPVNCLYLSQKDDLYAFLSYSNSLNKMCNTYEILQESKNEDPNLYANFKHPLGGYYQRPFEVTFAFLYTLYDKLRIRQNSSNQSDEEVLPVDLEKIFNLTVDEALLEFYVVHTRDEGSTFAGKMVWPFKEAHYFFRLLNGLESKIQFTMKEVMYYCVDFTQQKAETQTIVRNKICECLLKKQSILSLVEKHIYHAELDYFKPLYDMVLHYEPLLREGNEMYQECQDSAVELGRKIGMAVGKSENGKKGDLFALRKSRRMVDFLEQINRLQFKLGMDFVVPKEVYEGKLTEDNFQEFKQFCMIAALNSYNFSKSGKATQK